MQDYKQKSKQSFDLQAETYDHDKNGLHARNQYQAILEKVKDFQLGKVLDVGCGTGVLLEQLLKVHGGSANQFFGLDLSKKMLEIADSRLSEKATLVQGDAETLPFADCTFDTVLCCDSFHHYPNPQQAIIEFYRVIKPNGRLLISDYWKPFPIRQIMNLFLPYSNDGDVKIYSQKEIMVFLETVHFDVTCYEHTNSSSYIVIAKKDFDNSVLYVKFCPATENKNVTSQVDFVRSFHVSQRWF